MLKNMGLKQGSSKHPKARIYERMRKLSPKVELVILLCARACAKGRRYEVSCLFVNTDSLRYFLYLRQQELGVIAPITVALTTLYFKYISGC